MIDLKRKKNEKVLLKLNLENSKYHLNIKDLKFFPYYLYNVNLKLLYMILSTYTNWLLYVSKFSH